MAVDLHKLMAALNPDLFCEEFKDEYGERVNIRQRVKDMVKEKGILKTAKESKDIKPKESMYMEFDDAYNRATYYSNPFSEAGIKNPIEKHFLSYEAVGENLEPIYFWILDTLFSDYKDMKIVDKLVDNFVSSPGSAHFSEMGQKATRMQEEAIKMLGAANQVVKSILNLVYDLKEFRTRLDLYKKYKNGTPDEKRSSLFSLKQIWMDTVDYKRGTTSLKGLAQQFQYVTLIDAFMAADNLEALNDIDLNERVKRILQQRTGEFFSWIEMSEGELKKRYEIEKSYLKSQVSTVQLYARWAKPYLKAAGQLEQRASPSAALVNVFNSAIFELVLFGQSEFKPEDEVSKGDLPKYFKKTRFRKYVPVILIELKFRSIPERAGQQGYGFRGKVEITFTSYALNSDEVDLFKELVQKDDLEDVLGWVEGASTDSLEMIRKEIDEFLNEDKEKKDEGKKEEKKQDDTNPFSALFSIFKSEKKEEKKDEGKKGEKEIKPDSDDEKVIRNLSLIKARQECRKMYDMYKKSHNMPAF